MNTQRTQIWVPAAVSAIVCAAATAAGSFLTWLDARGSRPSLGMDHTSFSRMLVYSFANGRPYFESVGFVVVVLSALMVIGALTGRRTLTVIAALLALVASGMWIGLTVHHYNTPNLPNIHYLNPGNLPWSDLREGAWLTICGGALGLLSACLLRQRVRNLTPGE